MKKFTEKLNESNSDKSIPTTEELFKEYSYNISLAEGHYDYYVDKDDFKEALVKFAKLHVKAALESAAEKVIIEDDEYIEDGHYTKIVDKQSILDAYPLDNIK